MEIFSFVSFLLRFAGGGGGEYFVVGYLCQKVRPQEGYCSWRNGECAEGVVVQKLIKPTSAGRLYSICCGLVPIQVTGK